MTVFEAVQALNTSKDHVPVQRVIDVKAYYLSLYRIEMFKLYDKGYISDPTKFNESEIYSNVSDMNILDMFNSAGSINLTSGQTLFSLYKNKGNEEVYEFLSLLYYCLKYKEYCKDIDMFWVDQALSPDMAKFKPKLSLYMKGSCPNNRPNYDISMGIAKCLSEFGTEVGALSVDEYLWGLAMHELGVPKEKWYSDGLIDGALTHSEEIACMQGLLDGDFRATGGQYSSVLSAWLKNHKWFSHFTSPESKGLYQLVKSTNTEEIYLAFSTLLSALNVVDNYKLLAVHDSKIYFSYPVDKISFPLGMFVLSCNDDYEEVLLPQGNSVFGYSGEVYSQSRLDEDGALYAGCPIRLMDTNSTYSYYYDIDQTDIKANSWFSENDMDIGFSDEIPDALNMPKFAVGSPQLAIWNAYVNSLRSIDNLVAEIPVFPLKDFEKARLDVFKKIKEVDF